LILVRSTVCEPVEGSFADTKARLTVRGQY
jgi:hypothetical protein